MASKVTSKERINRAKNKLEMVLKFIDLLEGPRCARSTREIFRERISAIGSKKPPGGQIRRIKIPVSEKPPINMVRFPTGGEVVPTDASIQEDPESSCDMEAPSGKPFRVFLSFHGTAGSGRTLGSFSRIIFDAMIRAEIFTRKLDSMIGLIRKIYSLSPRSEIHNNKGHRLISMDELLEIKVIAIGRVRNRIVMFCRISSEISLFNDRSVICLDLIQVATLQVFGCSSEIGCFLARDRSRDDINQMSWHVSGDRVRFRACISESFRRPSHFWGEERKKERTCVIAETCLLRRNEMLGICFKDITPKIKIDNSKNLVFLLYIISGTSCQMIEGTIMMDRTRLPDERFLLLESSQGSRGRIRKRMAARQSMDGLYSSGRVRARSSSSGMNQMKMVTLSTAATDKRMIRRQRRLFPRIRVLDRMEG